MTRVAVTSIGMVTALGGSSRDTFARLLAGDRGFSDVTLFDASDQRSKLVAEVRGFRPRDLVRESDGAPSWSRSDALALVAAREALAESGLDRRGTRLGLTVGTTTAGMLEAENVLASTLGSGAARGRLELSSYPLSSPAARLDATIGPFSRIATLCSACSSSAGAIVSAAQWIHSGEADAVLAGGTDALCQLTLTGFNALGATDIGPCRPFDAARAGLTLGEGAAFLLLESEEAAMRRGARVLAWLTGWAAGSEAHHITQPEPSGAPSARLVARALARSRLAPSDIDYVNAHGTGTPQNDGTEAAALRLALGDEADRVFVSSSKGQVGHTLGAAGSVEAVITVLALEAQRLPPTAGLENPAAECRLRHVMGSSVAADVRAALSNAFGFGGAGATLLFERHDAPRRSGGVARVQVEVTGLSAWDGSRWLAGAECAELLEPEGVAAPESVDLVSRLLPAKSRRFDGQTAAAILGASGALEDAKRSADDAGLALGTAYGNVSRAAEFLRTIREKGPRRAPPADFPHLVPSSLSGNASIYLGARGPSFTTSELRASGDAAIALGYDWVSSGDATAFVAGAAEGRDAIVEEVFGPLCEPEDPARGAPGAAWVALEPEGSAAERGVVAAARVHRVYSFANSQGDVVDIEAPRGARARVLTVRSNDGLPAAITRAGWGDVLASSLAPPLHDVSGAALIAAGAALVLRKLATDVLVLTRTGGRARAIHLTEAG